MKQTCILILGMHRSGTSALSGTLNLLDVYLGSDLMKPTQYNPTGYFENVALFRVNEKLLALAGSSWSDIFYTEDKLEKAVDVALLKDTIRSEFEYSQLFAIKDPRLTYLFPLYRRVLEEMDVEIKILVPYRNPIEVANSLKKRDGFSIEQGMLLWAHHFLLSEKHSRDYPRDFIGFDELLDDPRSVIHRISDRVGIDLRSKYEQAEGEIAQFLKSGLKHHNISMDNLSAKTPRIVKEILALRENFDSQTALSRLDGLSEELFNYQALFYNDDVAATFSALKETTAALEVKAAQLVQTQKSLKETDAALVQTQKSLEETTAALEAKAGQLVQTQKSLGETAAALEAKEGQLAQTEKSLKETATALDVKAGELDQAERLLKAETGKREALDNELALLYNSRTWRYTRPLRYMINKIKVLPVVRRAF